MRALSHSSISLYLECPLKYRYKYMDKLPEEPRHFFSFGKSVHSALEFLYGVKLPPPPSLDQVLDVYRKKWLPEGYKDKDMEARYLAEGERIIREFYRTEVPKFRPPLFCEYNFRLQIEGVPVTGYIDRIDKLPDGKIHIIDYKTGKAFDLGRMKSDPQLALYQYACRESLGLEAASLTLYHLPSNTPFTVGGYSEGFEEGVRDRVAAVARGLTDQAFEPDPDDDKCRWCDYRKPNPAIGFKGCPAWRDEYASPEEKCETAYGNVDITCLVDKYGELKAKARALDDELKPVKDELERYFREKGYRKADGTRFRVTCDSKEKWDFGEKDGEVKRILEEAGLLEKVSSVSAAALQKLLKDRALDRDVREALESLGEKTVVRTIRYSALDKEPGNGD
ncbi:MAG: hypothetical protein A2902_00575 [Elusimicrobia bacterium RIFCSPLOWO2_01_FULL_64_13]|nr:MAG: hypothetical protein A2902_00575 [Elusimicrobia bacterium RIFCSPLOWO2_01_FULL_64_13]